MSILFANDWKRFPNAIVDYETKNESFLRMASLYNEMGIKNSVFHLVLLQPELQGVDPYDENLSNETKIKIGLECKNNFWYYIREVVRIPVQGIPEPISYIANRGNLALSWCFFNSVDMALIQPRQTGKSVSTDCISVWLIYIGAVNTDVMLITKDDGLRVKNVERLKKMRDMLPGYLLDISNKDSDNTFKLTCLSLKNNYDTAVAQNSELAANNIGRGFTAPVRHIDEGPFIRFIGITLPAAMMAGVAARESALAHGKPCGNIFTTTAGKIDDRDGGYMWNFINKGSVWNEILLDASNRDELITLIKNSSGGRKVLINGTFSYQQLGKTDEWAYNVIVENNLSKEEADRDVFNKWTRGSQSSPLSVELNQRIKDSEQDPLFSEITKDSYIIKWYYTQEELLETLNDTPIILGLDTSDAIGRDAIALVFTSAIDLSVIGAATINETNLLRFSRFLADVLIKYTNVTLIPERKSSAQAIIDAVIIFLTKEGIDPFRRMYNSLVDKKDEKPQDFKELSTPMGKRGNQFYDKWKKTIGFNTTGSSRDLLYSTILQNAAKDAGHLVKDRSLSTEIRGLIIKNGRIDHGNDGHDDSVIAWLMTHWMLTYTKNLSHYGIDSNKTLSKVYGVGRQLTDLEEYEASKQVKIKEDMEILYDELTAATDEYTVAQLEARLAALANKVKINGVSAFSIDSLLSQAAEERKFNIKKLSKNRVTSSTDRLWWQR